MSIYKHRSIGNPRVVEGVTPLNRFPQTYRTKWMKPDGLKSKLGLTGYFNTDF